MTAPTAVAAIFRGAAPEAVPALTNTIPMQPAGPGIESAVLLRGEIGMPAPASANASHSGSVGAVYAGDPAQETFAALDSGSAVGQPGWIHAGPQRAEAGFQDPALGWVGVRADLSSSGVHAALVPDSTGAAQILSGHIAGLSAYLTEQHTPVATLTVADPAASGSRSAADQSPQQSMSQNPEQSRGQGPQPNSDTNSLGTRFYPAQPVVAQHTDFDAGAWLGEGRGMNISVMA